MTVAPVDRRRSRRGSASQWSASCASTVMSRTQALADLDEVDRADRPAGVADRARDLPEHARAVVDLDADGQAVLGGRGGAHGRRSLRSGPWRAAQRARAGRRRRRPAHVARPRERSGGRVPDELFLIDGNSLAYRAFFALPESIATSTGVPTNAIFGFASMLVKILTEYGPKPTIVAWDAGTSGRKEVYAEYKAQRRSRPDLLKRAVAAPRAARRRLRLPQRHGRGLRGRRRDRLARRARARRRPPCRS